MSLSTPLPEPSYHFINMFPPLQQFTEMESSLQVITTHMIPGPHITTKLHLTDSRIALALDSGKLEIFSKKGVKERVLEGHAGAVWTLTSCIREGEEVLCSGSTDRDVRVWGLGDGFVSFFLSLIH